MPVSRASSWELSLRPAGRCGVDAETRVSNDAFSVDPAGPLLPLCTLQRVWVRFGA